MKTKQKNKTKLYKYWVTQTTYISMEIMAENETDAENKMRDEISMGSKKHIKALESAAEDYNVEEIK